MKRVPVLYCHNSPHTRKWKENRCFFVTSLPTPENEKRTGPLLSQVSPHPKMQRVPVLFCHKSPHTRKCKEDRSSFVISLPTLQNEKRTGPLLSKVSPRLTMKGVPILFCHNSCHTPKELRNVKNMKKKMKTDLNGLKLLEPSFFVGSNSRICVDNCIDFD